MKERILIVDDEAGVRNALSGVLRDEGYTVEAVDSGEACLDRAFSPALPPVRLDVEQIRRVVINLVDNAVEALDGAPGGRIVVETQHDAGNAVARIVIADNGPGVPAADREKLFMPYYSTKGRGSGLGLAIVRRIIAEHGGSIEVADNVPHGTVFTIELPL